MSLDEKRLRGVLENFEHLEKQLADPGIMADTARLTALSRERAAQESLAEKVRLWFDLSRQEEDVSGQIRSEADAEFLAVMKDELKQLQSALADLEGDIKVGLLPKDPNSGKNVIVEIRAGTGGDEAALFARDLFRMYTRFLEGRGLNVEMMASQETGLNGFKEVIFLTEGAEAYDLLHLEGGIHRVQRVPDTEASGRLHTSACTVAVIPEAAEEEIQINPTEIRIDVFRASGAGGQHVNKTESAVRITHLPTGIVVSCQDEKSQHKNRAKAMKVLLARLKEKKESEHHEKASAEKKGQIGSGDRSEKIRTYNYPQNRVTDHRINYTSHSLDRIMEGDMDELIEALLQAEKEKQLSSQTAS